MHIVYYITAHGYGHSLRATTIVKKISPYVKITFKTATPLSFFKEELGEDREFGYEAIQLDCGCIQKNSIVVDIEETFNQYSKIIEKSRFIVRKEVDWCKKNNIKGIVADIPSLAFKIAKEAGIPSLAITNFTWYDIYREYLSVKPLFEPIVKEMLSQYKEATCLLSLYPSLPMEYFKNRKELPPIGRKGKCDREIFKKKYGISENKKVALVYTGNFGLDANWKKLLEFSSWEFLSIYPLQDCPSNFKLVDKRVGKYEDLIASSDCVIGKAGYGVVSECMINRTPLIFLPRENFAEYPVLEDAIGKWGGGIKLSVKDFLSFNIGDALEKVINLRSSLPLVPYNSAEICANIIEDIFSIV